MIPWKEQCVKVITSQTTHATPGTQSTVTHGLGYAPSTYLCVPRQTVADDSSDTAGSIAVVKTDSTYVYVKSNKASATFTLLIHLQTDVGGRNMAP